MNKYRNQFLNIVKKGITDPQQAMRQLSVLAVKIEYESPDNDLPDFIDKFKQSVKTGAHDAAADRFKLMYQSLTDLPDRELIKTINFKEMKRIILQDLKNHT